MTLRNYLVFCFLFTCLFFEHNDCLAQKIELKDVAKIVLVEGWPRDSYTQYRSVEVVLENNEWKSYQTRYYKPYDFKKQDTIDNRSRTFIRTISPGILEQLLSIISKRDTGINIREFNIDTSQLIKYIDTVRGQINTQQKKRFIDTIKSESVLKDMLVRSIIPRVKISEQNYCGITITTKSNKSDTVYTVFFAELYHLPWLINKQKNYNPYITEIFNFINGNDTISNIEKDRLYKEMDKEIYWKYFQTPFDWEDFKNKQPTAYASFKNTLTPARLIKGKSANYGSFISTRLPPYLLIHFRFIDGENSASRYKSYEDTLVDVFKKSNFLFKYFKNRPGRVVYAYPGRMYGAIGKAYFREIGKYYKDIDKFDAAKSQLLYSYDSDGNESKWMILTNNEVVLLRYTGTLKVSDIGKFEEIIPDIFTSGSRPTKYVCIVFDKKGNRIGGNNNGADIGDY